MDAATLIHLALAIGGAICAYAGAYAAMKTTLALLLHRVTELEKWKEEMRDWKHDEFPEIIDKLRLEMKDGRRRV